VKKSPATQPLKAVTPPRKKSAAEEAMTKELQFLSLARARFKLAEESERESRKRCLEDLKFSLGEQWDYGVKTARVAENLPSLTINRIQGFIRMICNDQRMNRQGIQIDPVGDGADVKGAEIRQGYTRHVEQRSDAEAIYDETFDLMTRAGFHWARVLTEYADEDSLDLDLRIEGIRNGFRVYADPNAKKADKSDMDWLFYIENFQKDEYCGEFPDSKLASLSDWQSVGDQAPGWLQHDSVRVAEYFYVEKESYSLALLKDGSTVPADEIPRGETPVQVVQRYRRAVKWAKINGIEALDKKDWPGSVIPWVPDIADDYEVDGKQYLAGAVRAPMDAQRAYNFWITAASEKIALAPKSPWLMASGQQEGFTKLWEHANTSRAATLLYKPVKIGDTVLPPPTQVSQEPPIAGMVEMIRQADSDLKATFGLQDASMGKMNSSQESGEAVLARKAQGDIAILNYADNHARFLKAIGKIIIDLLPKIIRAPRLQRIINPDGTTTHVGIYNSEFDDEEEAKERLKEIAADEEAIRQIYDVGRGTYDVTVSTGTYQTKRQQAAESMMKMVDAYPQLMQGAADLIIKEMDWPGAEAISDRLRRMIPPQIIGNEQDGDPKQQLQTAQSQLQALMQNHDAVVKELNLATEIIRTKKLELDQKREASILQAQVQLLIQQAKTQGEAGLAALDAQLGTISHFMEQVHAKMFQDEAAADQPPIQPTQVTPPNPPKPDLSAGLLPPQPQQGQ
jgi:portal protein